MFNIDLQTTAELPAIVDVPNYYTDEEVAAREAAIAAFDDAAFIASCEED